MAEERMLNDEILLGLIKANSGGGGGGTTDYDDLNNKPQIGGVTLSGNKSASDLGLVASVDGKGLSTNDYTDADKAIVGGVTAALAGKQDALTAGDYIEIDGNEISVNPVVPNEEATYQIVSDGQEGGTYFVRINKIVDGEVVLTERYSTVDNVKRTFDDTIRIDYANTVGWNFTYELLVASTTHDAGYTYSWGYSAQVDIDEVVVTADHSGESLVLKSQMDTALTGKQDTLTFDDTPTDNSNNPVKSNGVYDALALKQDKTDNTLQTTSKTVVGGINELKSGLTTLDTEVNGDATTYPYADVITIEDAIPANLADCTVKIEPVQDLHGFDHPWVGGADDNIAEPVVTSSQTISNIVLDPIEVDSNIFGTTISAGTVGASDVNQWLVQFTAKETTSYRIIGAMLAGTITGVCRTLLYDLTDDTSVIYSIENNNFAVDLTADHQYVIAVFYRSGTTVTAQSLSIMVCKASTGITQFKPYSNICPITGHTEESVQRDGKNLCGELELGGFDASGLNDTSTQRVRTKYYIPVIEGQQYVLYSEPTASGATVNLSAQFYSKNDYATPRVADSGWLSNGSTITIPNGIKYIRCALRYIDNRSVTVSSFDNTQIELGSTATAYEPYAGKTYTIALGDTIYGGTVDFDSGVMTVDRAIDTVGNLSFTKYDVAQGTLFRASISGIKPIESYDTTTALCSAYVSTSSNDRADCTISQLGGGTSIDIIDNRYSDAGDFKTAMGSTQICYELATPTTIQLTPQQIQLLKGQNTLTASTGQISVTVNGVSGAIGSVQEQVNDHEERIETVESGLAGKANQYVYYGTEITVPESMCTLIMIGKASLDGKAGLYTYNTFSDVLSTILDADVGLTATKNDDNTVTFEVNTNCYISIIL